MASRIRVLSEQTINQIAAGEVIENPASVVKELVENSLDAGASEICVEILGGGRQMIRISDDGCGMNGDDALLCLERHATSKIRQIDDINQISTMGFRGEALPSIASISKFTLITRPQEPTNAPATLVIVDGGRLIKCCTAERSPGTTIEVKSLFFNVPVRKKFQRSPTYDAAEIQKVLTILAMGNPSIKFKLISNQSPLLSAPAPHATEFLPSLEERLALCLGAEFAAALLPIEEKGENFELEGFLGKPHCHRQNRTGQYLFINKRPVFSPMIANLIREAYGPTLPTNRFPVFVLHLKLPGDLLDVNVHPQKREVRLRYEQAFRQSFIQAIEKPLRSQQRSQPVSFDDSFDSAPQPQLTLPTPRFALSETRSPLQISSWSNSDPMKLEPPLALRELPKAEQTVSTLPLAAKRQPPQVVGTLSRYIVATDEQEREKLLIFDQQLAHQRILYEALNARQGGSHESQSLLIPVVLEYNAHESALLREYLPELNRLGLDIEELRPNTFILETIPTFFRNDRVGETVSAIIQELHVFQSSGTMKNEKNKHIALSASRAAMAANKQLDRNEAQLLINRLMLCAAPDQCPLGKPIHTAIGAEEIKNFF
jgi:DNA mismatch repair protein MutL